jgi:hypothetical protein
MQGLAAIQCYIGILWDLVQKTAALPEEKVSVMLKLLDTWLEPSATFSEHKAARAHGKLVHASCVFRLIRPFLYAVARFTQGFKSKRAKLTPPTAVVVDLSWVHYIILSSPNTVPLMEPAPLDIGWSGDASSSFGIGVIIGSLSAVWKWAPGIRVGPKQQFDISWAEAVSVYLGLLLVASEGMADCTKGWTLLVRSDNTG